MCETHTVIQVYVKTTSSWSCLASELQSEESTDTTFMLTMDHIVIDETVVNSDLITNRVCFVFDILCFIFTYWHVFRLLTGTKISKHFHIEGYHCQAVNCNGTTNWRYFPRE